MKNITSIIIILIIVVSCSKKTNKNWKENSKLFGEWSNLERDNNGYLIYKPCNGNNNSVIINKNSVIYDLGHESPDTLKIDSIKILKSLNEIEFSGTNEFYSIKSIMRIIDIEKKLYLLNWELKPKNSSQKKRNGKMMMTRKGNEKDFRLIVNACDNERKPEKEFLLIEY